MNYNVWDYGVVGDGKTYDTDSIQRAIDECSANGGGVVTVNNGTFLIGSIILKDDVELHITSTATLLGSSDLSKYHKDEQAGYEKIGQSLIYASGSKNFAITGSGTIDFQGQLFPNGVEDFRPVGVRFRDCKKIVLQGVLYKNAASFMIHPIHCSDMRIEGIEIYNMVQPNNDGIDLDGCQNVFISNCKITSTDDSIAFKVIEPGQPCSDVVVTNCILSSHCAAIRLGPDALEDIMRVTVSNCVIRDTILNGIKIQESMGADIRDVVFSNIVMDNVAGPISLRLAGWKLGDANEWAVFNDDGWENGRLQNILFDNIRGTGMLTPPKLGISITGTTKCRPKAITFSNIDITFPGSGTKEEGERRNVPDMDRAYPECGIFGVLPGYGLYVHHADGITLNNVRFTYEGEEHRPAIVCDDVSDLEITGLKAQGSNDAELIRLENTRDSRIVNSRVLGESELFLKVEGEQSSSIILDRHHGCVKQDVSITGDAPSDAVIY